MNRKQFIQSLGATCSNWTWSWSFVNHDRRFVVFGLWQGETDAKLSLILHSDWQYLGTRKQNGYRQAVEHIRLVEFEGYALWTFPMTGAARNPEKGDLSPSTITTFVPEITEHRLVVLSNSWYALPFDVVHDTIPEMVELDGPIPGFLEGVVSTVLVNIYERNLEARRACIAHFGPSCQACDLDLGALYGPIGQGYIHVHHIRPIRLCGGEYRVDPIKDLVPLCPNCHAMIHRRREPLTVDELRALLRIQKEAPYSGASLKT